MGERIRQGSWYPGVDALPPSVSEMLERARQLNVKLLAYVYPCLLFEAHPEAWVRGSLDLSSPGVAEWLAQLLCDFMEAHIAQIQNLVAARSAHRNKYWSR